MLLCGGRRRWAPLLAAAVTLCLVIGLRLASEVGTDGPSGRGPTAPLSGDTQETAARCSDLSIVCLADSVAPAEGAQHAEEIAFGTLQSSPLHVVLAGHSRLRQVFEQLQPLLGAPLRTRGGRPPPLADRDSPVAPPLSDNSTCLAALPKGSHQPANVWCSRAADWGRLLLDFRWRHLTESLSALLGRLAARSPDWLVIGHGLYQDGNTAELLSLRANLQPLLTRMRQLQRRGTTAVWMLEAGKNRYTQPEIPISGHGLVVLNALLSEAALAAGVPLWSAHLPLVQDWMLRDCRRPHAAAAASRTVCDMEQLHTDEATNRGIARQLITALAGRVSRQPHPAPL